MEEALTTEALKIDMKFLKLPQQLLTRGRHSRFPATRPFCAIPRPPKQTLSRG